MYAWQCLECGCRVGEWLKREFVFSQGIPEPWDEGLEERHRKRAGEAFQKWRLQQRSAENEAWQSRYDEHLRSGHWQALRQLVFTRCGGMCEGCGTNRAQHVHHLTYANMGDEFLWELVGICRDCHERYHGKEIGR